MTTEKKVLTTEKGPCFTTLLARTINPAHTTNMKISGSWITHLTLSTDLVRVIYDNQGMMLVNGHDVCAAAGIPDVESLEWAVIRGHNINHYPLSIDSMPIRSEVDDGPWLAQDDIAAAMVAYRSLWLNNSVHSVSVDDNLSRALSAVRNHDGKIGGMSLILGGFAAACHKAKEESRSYTPKEQRRDKVYFIQHGTRVKIGMSHDPQARLRQLSQSGSRKASMKLLCLITPMDARRCEERLHRLFAADRVFGEWFRFSARIRNFLEKATNVERM